MDCRQVTRLVTSYAAGELAADKAAEVAAHLENCSQCGKLLEEYRLVGLVLRSSAGEAPQADARFFRALGRRLDEVDRRKNSISPRPVFRWHVVGGVAAAAAAVFMVTTYFLPNLNSTPRVIIAVPQSQTIAMRDNHPRSYTPDYSSARTQYVPVTTMPSINATDQLHNPYGLSMPMPRLYFPQRSWSIQGTNQGVSQSITKVEYDQLQDKLQKLESRMDALEQKAKPAN
jgi:hypothetical protein